MALGLAWFGCSLATGVLARLVGGVAGWMLLSIAVLGLVATGAVVSGAVAVAIGIVPIVGGLVAYRLSRRAQRMAES